MSEETNHYANDQPSESTLEISHRIADHSEINEHIPLTLYTNGRASTNEEEPKSTVVAVDAGTSENVPITNSKRKASQPSFEFKLFWQGVWNRLDPEHVGLIRNLQLLAHMARTGNIKAKLDRYRRLIALFDYLTVFITERPYPVGSYYSRCNCYPLPIFMLSISLLEIAVFCYYGFVLGKVSGDGSLPMGSPLMYNPRRRYEIWRYLSYMFLHNGWFHLAGNVFVQLIVGIPLELVHKFWRLAVIYFLGVLAGSLGTSFTDPDKFMDRALAKVYALQTAHLANYTLNWAEMGRPICRLTFWLLWFGIDAGRSVNAKYGLIGAASHDKVGYPAHMFGAVAGVLAGIIVLKNLVELKWERKVWWLSVTALVLLFTALIVWNLVSTAFPRTDCGSLTWPGNATVVRIYCL